MTPRRSVRGYGATLGPRGPLVGYPAGSTPVTGVFAEIGAEAGRCLPGVSVFLRECCVSSVVQGGVVRCSPGRNCLRGGCCCLECEAMRNGDWVILFVVESQ